MQIEAETKNKPTGKSVLLFSGGMDSLMMAYLLKPNVLLYIPHGQRYEQREFQTLLTLTGESKVTGIITVRYLEDVLNLSKYERRDAIIPLRNLFLLSFAAQYGETIYIGAIHGDRTVDKSLEFLSKTESMFNYLYQGGNPDALKLSYSCYEGKEEPCQQCKACVRKAVALINNNIEVPGFNFNNVEWLQPGSSIRRGINKGEWREREDQDFEKAFKKVNFI